VECYLYVCGVIKNREIMTYQQKIKFIELNNKIIQLKVTDVKI